MSGEGTPHRRLARRATVHRARTRAAGRRSAQAHPIGVRGRESGDVVRACKSDGRVNPCCICSPQPRAAEAGASVPSSAVAYRIYRALGASPRRLAARARRGTDGSGEGAATSFAVYGARAGARGCHILHAGHIMSSRRREPPASAPLQRLAHPSECGTHADDRGREAQSWRHRRRAARRRQPGRHGSPRRRR